MVRNLHRDLNIAKRMLDAVYVVTYNTGPHHFKSWKTGKHVMWQPATVNLLDSLRYPWFILVLAFTIESNGKRKISPASMNVKQHCHFNDLLPVMLQLYDQNISEAQGVFVNGCAVAVPFPPSFKTEEDEERFVEFLVNLVDIEEAWNVAGVAKTS